MTTPLDAAALILLSPEKDRLLWARRNPAMRFLGGFHGFTGGKVEPLDAEVPVEGASDRESAIHIAAAVREAFEEVGLLLVRNGEKLTRGQRISLHDDLVSGRDSFAGILQQWGLWIDAADFHYSGFWTTPEFSPIRFRTRFFSAVCPEKQEPYEAIGEMQRVEFIGADEALARWERSKVLIAPPVLIALREYSASSSPGLEAIRESARRLEDFSHSLGGDLDYIELNSRIACLPLRTKTLPPATHTNCFIVGAEEFIVIDPASRDEAELGKLFRFIDSLFEKGGVCRAIIVSHLHRDHVGGELALKQYLQDKHSQEVPVLAHRETAKSLEGVTEFDGSMDDGEKFSLKDGVGGEFAFEVLHTPGHAKGHLCFYDPELGFLLSMDNVLAVGSVLIDPPEGNMTDYLRSLERMRDLPGLRFLCGSHGPAVHDARGKIEEYISHRLERERQVVEAMEDGASNAEEVAAIVYRDLAEDLFPLAVRSAEAHIQKIREGSDAGLLGGEDEPKGE